MQLCVQVTRTHMCLAKGLQGSPGGRSASSGKDVCINCEASPDPEDQILTFLSFTSLFQYFSVVAHFTAKPKSTVILINM